MRKRTFLLKAALSLVLVALCPAISAGGSSAKDRWELINTDAYGNRAYIDTDSLERLDISTVKVTMKFVNSKNGSVMYFVDEFDCKRERIKRLSVSLKGPPCTGGIDYDSSFEGQWDRISTGLEEKLRDTVCVEGKASPETENSSQ